MSEPILDASHLRLDVCGTAAVEGLTFTAHGTRAIVVGAPRVLFEAACGVVRPAEGRLATGGVACVDALAQGTLAGAPLDPPMPPAWSPLEYATWSARLAGRTASEARARAADALASLRVPETSTPLAGAPIALKRATVIAAAMATGALMITLEDPCASLDDAAAASFGEHVARALEERGCAWVVFRPSFAVDSPLAAAADEVLMLGGSEVRTQGTPVEVATRARCYAVIARGARAQSDALLAGAPGRVMSATIASDGAQLVVELAPQATTRDLFAVARACGALIVELRPLS